MVVLSKSVNPKRIAENIKATQIQLDAEDIKRIESIDKVDRMFRVCLVYIKFIMGVTVHIYNPYSLNSC